jgi:hypothetical protein
MSLNGKWFLSGLVFLAACFPKEEAIVPKPRVNKSVAIDAGEAKNGVAFYSLENSELLAETSPEAWDIYADDKGFKLNFLRSTRVAEFSEAWENVTDTIGLKFHYLTTDFEGIQWQLKENTNYVFDLGLDDNYVPLGFMKLSVKMIDGVFNVTHSTLSAAQSISREFSNPYIYYSMMNDELVELPRESTYDIVFGKYTDFVVFADEEADYLVYGTLLGNSASFKIDKAFDDITAADFDSVSFDFIKRTTIGWDWKTYSLEKGAYEINPNTTYLIQTKNGFKYKFRFVNFYNTQGISGHPTFEYKLI